MCHMIVDCCGQNRTYEKFFGLTATRLCMIKREYMELFELIFVEMYETIHRLETNRLRNVAKVYKTAKKIFNLLFYNFLFLVFLAIALCWCHSVVCAVHYCHHRGDDNLLIPYFHQNFVSRAFPVYGFTKG